MVITCGSAALRKSGLIVGIVVFLAIVLQTAGASGYKDFSWGESPRQVEQKAGELQPIGATAVYFPQPIEALGYLYPVEFSDPRQAFPSIQSTSISAFAQTQDNNSRGMIFFFSSDRLVAVQITFTNTDPYPAMAYRYGDMPLRPVNIGTVSVTVAVWTDILNNRTLVYSTPADATSATSTSASSSPFGTSITYLDTSWLVSVAKAPTGASSATQLFSWLN